MALTLLAKISTFIIASVLFWRSVVTERAIPFCPQAGISVSILHFPPLTMARSSERIEGLLGEFFFQVAKRCFVGECKMSEKAITTTFFNSTEDFMSTIRRNKTNIAFPITRSMKMSLSRRHKQDTESMPTGVTFELFLTSPAYVLIVDVENVNNKVSRQELNSLFENAWPIVAFTLLIAGISGMVVWILETYFNEKEFPRSFTKGSYEGFWWAFVTMTTVGYGDKTPKSILGRVFGVLWILLGLVVIATFTAKATSALSIGPKDLVKLEGGKIGVLNGTSGELEAKQRGANVKVFSSIYDLYNKLKDDEIEGILMDRYVGTDFLSLMNEARFKVFYSFNVEIPYYLAMPYSQLSRSLSDQDSCFKTQIDNPDMGDLLIKYLKPVKVFNDDEDSVSLFSGESPNIQKALLLIMTVFLALAFVGIVAEVVYMMARKAKKVQNGDDGINLKQVRVQSAPARADIKDVGDKVDQLVREVGKLQEQLAAISSHANGSLESGQTTIDM